jgi:hypothetical protein
VESNLDNAAVNHDTGAFTMAQILPSTWTAWAVNANPDQDGTADPTDPADVIFTAARYLCALGAGNPDTQRVAVFSTTPARPQSYERAASRTRPNASEGHARNLDRLCQTADYVGKVFAQAAAYAADSTANLPAADLLDRVISFAYAKIGTLRGFALLLAPGHGFSASSVNYGVEVPKDAYTERMLAGACPIVGAMAPGTAPTGGPRQGWTGCLRHWG